MAPPATSAAMPTITTIRDSRGDGGSGCGGGGGLAGWCRGEVKVEVAAELYSTFEYGSLLGFYLLEAPGSVKGYGLAYVAAVGRLRYHLHGAAVLSTLGKHYQPLRLAGARDVRPVVVHHGEYLDTVGSGVAGDEDLAA